MKNMIGCLKLTTEVYLTVTEEGETYDHPVECEVAYTPGFYVPAKLSCHPDDAEPESGEEPEIVSVVRLDTSAEVLPLLSRAAVTDLIRACWDHQQATANDRDYDDYDVDMDD
jgi:hypothetical protein